MIRRSPSQIGVFDVEQARCRGQTAQESQPQRGLLSEHLVPLASACSHPPELMKSDCSEMTGVWRWWETVRRMSDMWEAGWAAGKEFSHLVSSRVGEPGWSDEELQEQRTEFQARAKSGRGDASFSRSVCRGRASPAPRRMWQRQSHIGNGAKGLPGEEVDEYYMLSLVLVRWLGHTERRGGKFHFILHKTLF